MNILQEVRQCNKRIYALAQDMISARAYAYPKAVTYDNIGGSHGGSVDAIEQAYIRVDDIASRLIIEKRRRDRLTEVIKRAAFKSEINEREWLVIVLLYIMTKPSGKPYTWREVITEVRRLYQVSDRQVYNYNASACKRFCKI